LTIVRAVRKEAENGDLGNKGISRVSTGQPASIAAEAISHIRVNASPRDEKRIDKNLKRTFGRSVNHYSPGWRIGSKTICKSPSRKEQEEEEGKISGLTSPKARW